MMVADATLADSLQALVDARLDTIDRMLLGRVPRADRTAITREVEAQIHDLLAERAGGEVDRDLILSVLARLDPPEAYLPDAAAGEPAALNRPSPTRPVAPNLIDPAKIARKSAIIGLFALGLVCAAGFSLGIASTFHSDPAAVVAIGMAGLAFLIGFVGSAVAVYARFAGYWAIVGFATGLMTIL